MERRNHSCIEHNIMLLMAFGENDLKQKRISLLCNGYFCMIIYALFSTNCAHTSFFIIYIKKKLNLKVLPDPTFQDGRRTLLIHLHAVTKSSVGQ